MNIFIGVMLIFSIIGLIDKILGGKWGFDKSFDRGLQTMGSLALAMLGLYSVGITWVNQNSDYIFQITKDLPFDPSLIVGSLLATDLGAYSMAMEIANTRAIGLFTGVLVASSLGATVCFQLPIFMSSLDKKDINPMMNGILIGLLTIPFGLILGGIILKIPINDFIVNTLPVILICLLIGLGYFKARNFTINILIGFGIIVKIISYGLFSLVLLGLFIPQLQVASIDVVNEGLIIVCKIGVVVSGACVLSDFILKNGKTQIKYVADKLGVNEESVIGLILSMPNSISMLPLYNKMDTRGKILNGAFSVSGAYVLGGQLAFVDSVESSNIVFVYMLFKLVAGFSAVALAMVITSKLRNEKSIEILSYNE